MRPIDSWFRFKARAVPLLLVTLLPSITMLPVGTLASASEAAPFNCSVPVMAPPPAKQPARTEAVRNIQHNALSYLMVRGRFRDDFGVEATLSLPKIRQNVNGFYSNWIMLIPFGGSAFVQIELMRWGTYHFRNEIALTWAYNDGRLIYRDTGMFLDDGKHRLKITMKGSAITLYVDGLSVCSVARSAFFDRSEKRFYFQIGTEVSQPGELVTGEAEDILVKDDADDKLHSYRVTCVYRGYGTSWQPDGAGRFHAEGGFDPTAPYLRFEGQRNGTPCIF